MEGISKPFPAKGVLDKIEERSLGVDAHLCQFDKMCVTLIYDYRTKRLHSKFSGAETEVLN